MLQARRFLRSQNDFLMHIVESLQEWRVIFAFSRFIIYISDQRQLMGHFAGLPWAPYPSHAHRNKMLEFVRYTNFVIIIIIIMLSYRRDRAAVCVIVFAKSRTLELGDNILRTL